MIARGAYFLADDAVFDWAIALAKSLRRHDPDLPCIWIPFGGGDELLRRHLPKLRVDAWEESDALHAWDRVGQRLYPHNPVGARLFRKMATFSGAFERFAFLDSDVVLRRSLDWAFEAHACSGGQLAFYDEGLNDVYAGSSLRHRMVSDYGSRGWNTGFWLAVRRSLTMSDAEEALPDALRVAAEFAPTGEQPFFNFVLDRSGVSSASLRDAAARCGMTTTESLIVAGDGSAAPAPALHWAGVSQPSFFMPGGREWLRARVGSGRPLAPLRLVRTLVVRPVARRVRRQVAVRSAR